MHSGLLHTDFYGQNSFHTILKVFLWLTAILMARRALRVVETLQIPAHLSRQPLQPLQRAKCQPNPALTAVFTKLQHRQGLRTVHNSRCHRHRPDSGITNICKKTIKSGYATTSIESILYTPRQRLGMQEAPGLRWSTRWPRAYLLGLRLGVHHYLVNGFATNCRPTVSVSARRGHRSYLCKCMLIFCAHVSGFSGYGRSSLEENYDGSLALFASPHYGISKEVVLTSWNRKFSLASGWQQPFAASGDTSWCSQQLLKNLVLDNGK